DGMRARNVTGVQTCALPILVLRRANAPPIGDEELLFFKEITGRLGSALASAHVFLVAQRERDRAEAANAAKDRFVAAISHELRKSGRASCRARAALAVGGGA